MDSTGECCIKCGKGEKAGEVLNHVGPQSILEYAIKLNLTDLAAVLENNFQNNIPTFIHLTCQDSKEKTRNKRARHIKAPCNCRFFLNRFSVSCNLFSASFLVTPCLVVAVQPFMEWIPIKKKKKKKKIWCRRLWLESSVFFLWKNMYARFSSPW